MTGIARAVTVGRGITSERGTVGRLRAAAGDVLDDATVRELEDAFRFLWGSDCATRWSEPRRAPNRTTASIPERSDPCPDRRSGRRSG